MQEINFTKITNDTNGNGRYVCSFLSIVNDKDREQAQELSKICTPFKFPTEYLYNIAINKAKLIGGKKYHNKKFGGGIVFQSNSLQVLNENINKIK
jgi:hypothetical protein